LKTSISEFEIKRVEKIVGQSVEKIRPNTEIRDRLDFSFTFYDQSFEIGHQAQTGESKE
jgi:hypothetical protein